MDISMSFDTDSCIVDPLSVTIDSVLSEMMDASTVDATVDYYDDYAVKLTFKHSDLNEITEPYYELELAFTVTTDEGTYTFY